jgi:hypothetical protein
VSSSGRRTFSVEAATGKVILSGGRSGTAGTVTLRGGTATVTTNAVRRESLVFLTLTALRCGSGSSGGGGVNPKRLTLKPKLYTLETLNHKP